VHVPVAQLFGALGIRLRFSHTDGMRIPSRSPMRSWHLNPTGTCQPSAGRFHGTGLYQDRKYRILEILSTYPTQGTAKASMDPRGLKIPWLKKSRRIHGNINVIGGKPAE